MAFSNPQIYMDELAAPLCRRFEAEPTAYDLAISTCIILYHFADVVAKVRGCRPHDMAEEIALKVPAFHTIRAVANAGKHVELTRHSKSELVGLRAEHLARRTAATCGDETSHSERETIVVMTPDEEEHDVLRLCLSVLAELYRQSELFQV